MDMKIDAKRIRAEREKRAWSQEHLAAASGLGLRTIQRIERTGAASLESTKALAAVFALDAAALRVVDAQDPAAFDRTRPPLDRAPASARRRRLFRSVVAAAAAGLVAAIALIVTEPGRAAEVLLDVGVSLDDANVVQSRLATDPGVAAEIVVRDLLRLLLEPTVEKDGKIMLSAQIFAFRDGRYELVSAPKLVTPDGKEAEVRVTGPDGKTLRMLFTPYYRQPPKLLKAL